jgi:LPXTG-site transpeptidase (sortase) family protein
MSDAPQNSNIDQTPKPHVSATPQVANWLKLKVPENEAAPVEVPSSDLPIKGLPIAQSVPEPPSLVEQAKNSGAFSKIVGNLYIKDQPVEQGHDHSVPSQHFENMSKTLPKNNTALKIVKAAVPYLAIFTLAIFVYFFFFSGVNFSDYFQVKASPATPKETALQQLEGQSLASYQTWIAQFYFDVTDNKLLDPEADNSANGLTNFEKYLLNLNPKSYDTLGLGMSDSESLARGINPLSGAPLNDSQKQIIDRYFDMEVISNRLTLQQLKKNGGAVAGASVSGSVVSGASSGPQNSPSAGAAQTGGVLGSDVEVNTSIPGRLEIPSLNANAPLMWTDDPKNFDQDLQSGVVHYPGTSLPGQIGTAYISGHSSNYVWAKGNYNHVFTHLGDLADNTSFKITVVQKNGHDAILHYVVVGRQQYDPKDQAQFQNTGNSVVALSTCWPVGSTAKRLVVFGQLTQVEK